MRFRVCYGEIASNASVNVTCLMTFSAASQAEASAMCDHAWSNRNQSYTPADCDHALWDALRRYPCFVHKGCDPLRQNVVWRDRKACVSFFEREKKHA